MSGPIAQRSARARELLLSFLDEEQKADFNEFAFFFVDASDGETYAIGDGWSVYSIDREWLETWYCVWATETYGAKLPLEDSLLAQLLALRTNPQLMLSRACTNGIYEDELFPDLAEQTRERWSRRQLTK